MKQALDTHAAFKKLQAAKFTDEQAESIVEITFQNKDDILSAILSMDRRLEEKFDKIDQRFEKIDQRFDKLEGKLEGKIDASHASLKWLLNTWLAIITIVLAALAITVGLK